MPKIKVFTKVKKTLYDYINIILKDKNKNIDKAHEIEKLIRDFKVSK